MKRVWRCFHCDSAFRNERHAAEHFGVDSALSLTACQIKGHENALIRTIREQEEQLARYRAEDGDILRAMESMRSEHEYALRKAEEVGYNRGVVDTLALPATERASLLEAPNGRR